MQRSRLGSFVFALVFVVTMIPLILRCNDVLNFIIYFLLNIVFCSSLSKSSCRGLDLDLSNWVMLGLASYNTPTCHQECSFKLSNNVINSSYRDWLKALFHQKGVQESSETCSF